MKLLKLIAAPLLFAAFAGCDDPEEMVAITGNWVGTQSVLEGYASGVPVPVVNETDEDFDLLLEINDDGTLRVVNDGAATTGTWSYGDDNRVIEVSADLQNDFLDPVETFEIMQLTQTSLVLFLDKSGTFPIEGVGDVTGRVELTLSFSRVND